MRLNDRIRRPYRFANQLPEQITQQILKMKRQRPSWGAPKIQELLKRKYPEIHSPARSTIHCILDRHGLVKRHKKRRGKAQGTPLRATQTPNDLWCADYKGEFTLTDRRYCYPLTITDYASRFILACEALESTSTSGSFEVFERALQGIWLAQSYSFRQWPTLCLPYGVVWAEPAFSMVGYDWEFLSNESSQAIRSKTAATNACILRLRKRPPNPPVRTSYSNKKSSTLLSMSSIKRDRIKP